MRSFWYRHFRATVPIYRLDAPSPMSKPAKTVYACSACAAEFSKWAGQCSECGAWNTLAEQI